MIRTYSGEIEAVKAESRLPRLVVVIPILHVTDRLHHHKK